MKTAVILLVLFASSILFAQQFNQSVIDTVKNKKMLI